MTDFALPNYKILEKLGQGGMGEVFLALDTRLNRKVALKFLSQEFRDDPQARKRLLREARSAATLDHPFICKVYEAVDEDDKAFIAMEYVEGHTLAEKVAGGPLPLKDTLGVAMEIAEALEVAHDHGIVHRDLKPANIMLGRGGHIKVMDFGLAKQARPLAGMDLENATTTALTEVGTVVGTLDYMAPEQLRGEEVDARADIFSFGVILCEMLTGRNPLHKPSKMETASGILSNLPVALQQSDVSHPFLNHIVQKTLEKKPDNRYQSIKELLADLRMVRTESISGSGRRLAAIMFTDIVSYSATTGQDEALAMELLREHWRLLRPVFAKHNGQEIKTIGDAFLVEFPSAVQGTQCAIEIQRMLFERNSKAEPNRRIVLRIGLHLGDVIHQQNDVSAMGSTSPRVSSPMRIPGVSASPRISPTRSATRWNFPLSDLRRHRNSRTSIVPSRSSGLLSPGWIRPKRQPESQPRQDRSASHSSGGFYPVAANGHSAQYRYLPSLRLSSFLFGLAAASLSSPSHPVNGS